MVVLGRVAPGSWNTPVRTLKGASLVEMAVSTMLMLMPNITDVQMSTGPVAHVFHILILVQYALQVVPRAST